MQIGGANHQQSQGLRVFVNTTLVWCLVVWLTFNSESCVSSVSGLDLSLLAPFHHGTHKSQKTWGVAQCEIGLARELTTSN